MAFVCTRLLTLLMFSLSIFSTQCLAKCHVDDETGLLAFKSGITQDPSGMLKSWKAGTNCCTWSGVSCLNSVRVIAVSVYGEQGEPDSYLSGTISPSLSKLRYLQSFVLYNLRNISGTFPTFLYSLPNLLDISLLSNQLSGPLPADIGTRLSNKLSNLDLSGNRFSGPIPSSLSKLAALSQLRLDGNAFTGPIPYLKNLTYLNLEKNQLSGGIPDIFTSFPDLTFLSLSYNKLTGEIPPSISALSSKLTYLDLGHNALSGKIPDYIGNFKGLRTLDLSTNQFTGLVPSMKDLTQLIKLNLARNQLADPFPQLNVKEIESLDLSYNRFKLGQIPKWVATAPMVNSLKLAGCGLKFQLESFKPTVTFYYDSIDLSDNEISGSPIWLLNKTLTLEEFKASGNQLRFNMSNLILPSFNNLIRLEPYVKYLDLSRNQMFGNVPEIVSGMEKLDVSHNHLCGQLPATKFSAQVFQGNDCLCGSPLPPCKK